MTTFHLVTANDFTNMDDDALAAAVMVALPWPVEDKYTTSARPPIAFRTSCRTS